MQISLYPDRVFDLDLFHETFHKTLFTLFRTFDGELTAENPNCSDKLIETNYTCQLSNYSESKCNQLGIWAYVFSIIYIVVMKLILLTLLYALFNAKALTLDANIIWRYQRFQMINDFDLHLPLPAPLNVFCYIFYGLRFFIKKVCCCLYCEPQVKEEDVYNCKDCPDESMVN